MAVYVHITLRSFKRYESTRSYSVPWPDILINFLFTDMTIVNRDKGGLIGEHFGKSFYLKYPVTLVRLTCYLFGQSTVYTSMHIHSWWLSWLHEFSQGRLFTFIQTAYTFDQQFFAKHKIAQEQHPLYSLDLALCDFPLFPKERLHLKRMIWGY